SLLDRSLATFDVATGKQTHITKADEHARAFDISWHGNSWTLPPLVVSPDGKQVASVFTGCAVMVYEVTTRKAQNAVDGHVDFITRLAYSADGSVITTAGFKDHTLRTWDAKTGKLKGEIRPDRNAEGMYASPDGRLVATIVSDGARPAKQWAVRITEAGTARE